MSAKKYVIYCNILTERSLKLLFFVSLCSSYLITAPETFRRGMMANVNVLILRAEPADAPVIVNATFLIDSKQIATASGQFYAGLHYKALISTLLNVIV